VAWAPALEPGGGALRRVRRLGKLALVNRWLRQNVRGRG
jgi:hypothetical protein